MRDLLGFLSYIIFEGEDPDKARPANLYATNIFGCGQGPLFNEVRKYDPLYQPSPFLDDQLYAAVDKQEDWILSNPREFRDPGSIDAFQQKKRRAYFEHKKGKRL